MKIFSVGLMFGLAAAYNDLSVTDSTISTRVQKLETEVERLETEVELLAKVETAPMTCTEYQETYDFQMGLYETCTQNNPESRWRRACGSYKSMAQMTEGTLNMYCSSDTPSPSPSLAPSFDVSNCHCMNYGSVDANTFVTGNFNGTSDTEGTLYVGGDATLKGYSVGEALPADCSKTSIFVEGALDFQSGRVYSGNIEYGPGSTIPVGVASGMPSGCTAAEHTSSFDFAGAAAHYEALSTSLCAKPDTGIIRTEGVSISMAYTNVHTEVFSIPCENFTAAASINFNGMSDTATVILNLRGAECTLDSEVHVANASRILFNLCDATDVHIHRTAIHASVLAPLAHIDGTGSVIWGQTVAKSFAGQTQQNNAKCHVCIN